MSCEISNVKDPTFRLPRVEVVLRGYLPGGDNFLATIDEQQDFVWQPEEGIETKI